MADHPHQEPKTPFFLFSIPLDLLFIIFSKLTVKSLLRLQCVSKSLHAIISSPGHHQKMLPPVMSGFFRKYIGGRIPLFVSLESSLYTDLSSVDTTLAFLPLTKAQRQRLFVMQSSYGLLLVQVHNKNPFARINLFVCNPATRRWAKIPPPPAFINSSLALGFDPSHSLHYKVVCFLRNGEAWATNGLMVFSSETGKWTTNRRITSAADIGIFNLHVPWTVTFLNGLMYVLARDPSSRSSVTLAVNAEEHTFCVVRAPELENQHFPPTMNMCLGYSQGLLHMAMTTNNEMMVWVLQDPASNRYSLKLRVTLVGDVMAFHSDLDVVFLEVPESNRVLSYHIGSGRASEIPNLQAGHKLCGYSACYSQELDLPCVGQSDRDDVVYRFVRA